MKISGQRVLLTGASSGLGPYIARRLARAGAVLVLAGRNQTALDAVAAEVNAAATVTADLSVPADLELLRPLVVEADILIANAGLPGAGALEDFSSDEVGHVLAVNLGAPILLARMAVPEMRRRGRGHLVFMASMAGHVAGARTSLYNATKFGLRGFGLALRQELAPFGVGVSLVSPTYVSEAGMWAETGVPAPPLAGTVTPAAVAEAVVRAIVRNRREIQVASPLAVTGSRLLAAFPALGEILSQRARLGEHPQAAAAAQRHKR